MQLFPMKTAQFLRFPPDLDKFLIKLPDSILQGPVLIHKGFHPLFNLAKSFFQVFQSSLPQSVPYVPGFNTALTNEL